MSNFRYSQDESLLPHMLTTANPDIARAALVDARAGLFLWAYVVSEVCAQAMQQQLSTWKLFGDRVENAEKYFPGDVDGLRDMSRDWKSLSVDMCDLGPRHMVKLVAPTRAVVFWLTERWEVMARGEGFSFSTAIPDLRNPGEARSVAAGLVKRAIDALAPDQGAVPAPLR